MARRALYSSIVAFALGAHGCSETEHLRVGMDVAAAYATEIQCYLVADSGDYLTIVNKDDLDPATNETTVGRLMDGATRIENVESIAFDPITRTLWAANDGQLGVVNVDTAAFTPLPNPVGSGTGADGTVAFGDIDGLAWDPFDSVLYGAARRIGDGDVLIQIDTTTGARVASGFGAGADYVVMPITGTFGDVDDIAIDPVNGDLYAVFNRGGLGGDILVRVDKQTGATTNIGAIGIADVEGLTFAPDGVLWGTSGASAEMFRINKTTGAAFDVRLLDNGGDYESADCFVVPAHELAVEKTLNRPTPRMGDTVTYTLRVRNNGPHAATNVSLEDVLPTGVTYQRHTASTGTYDPATGLWTIGSLAVTATATLTIDVRVDVGIGTTVTNTAQNLGGDSPDPLLANNTASVSFTVGSPPDALDDTATTSEDTAVTVPVLANDTDPEGDTLNVNAVSDPASGTAVINADGTVTYTPDPNFYGTDTFTYTVDDGNGNLAIATVTVTVTSVPDAPIAVDDTVSTTPGTAVDIDVLGNDSDGDGDPLTITQATQPDNGTVTVNADGTLHYTPDPGFQGTDTFTYTVEDSTGRTATATVTVIVDGDRDGDGLSDSYEDLIGSDPDDADTDDDGITDGAERAPAVDSDGDGTPNVIDPDSDNDGIYDGTEDGVTLPHADTDVGVGVFVPDADPSTTTDPLEPDTDDGGVSDGDEDANHDGRVDDGERDPNDPSDDLPSADTDGDGLSDEDEIELGSDPDDADTDDDGVSDGAELDPGADTDGDGTPNVLDPDSDNDGLHDGTELGVTEPNADTDVGAGVFVPDADPSTTTDPLDPDTDSGGVSDGDEDENHDGRVDDGERDPNDGADDMPEPPVDTDGDGVTDDVDNCPADANTDQADLDEDNLGDVCDPDADGNGYTDGIGVAGGGCSAGGESGGGAALLMLGFFLLAPRPRRRLAGMIAAMALCVAAWTGAPAHAQGQEVERDYTLERFRLSMDRHGVLDVESGAVPQHMTLDVGLWLGYSDDPLTLYMSDAGGDRERIGALVSHRVGGELVGSLALRERFQIGVEVPLILSQDQDVGMLMGPPGSISSVGLGNLRLSPKLGLLRAARHGLDLAVIVGFTLPTSTADDYFGDAGATFVPELALSRPITATLRAAANIGYRARPDKQALDLAVDDEIFAHLGAGFLVTPAVELDATVSLATGADDIFGSFNRNHTELKAGVAYSIDRLVTFASAGVGLSEGFGTPDWRALAGMRFGWEREAEPPPVVVEQEPIPAPRDTDGDGMTDDIDQCVNDPETANSYQDDDGCPDEIPDTDGDGLNDQVDRCPEQPEDKDGFTDEDGCIDPDNDQDGVLDGADACRDQTGVIENRGCPDTDRDSDTVVDRLDNCPDEPGTPENRGCKQKQLVVISKDKLEILDRVFFRTNAAVILPKSFKLLDNVAQVISSHPEIPVVQVEGHTDDRGDDAYNKDLSQRRANSVVDYLVKKGVDRSRLRPVGFGEEKPIAPNDVEKNRANNRRVEFNIVGAEGIEQQNGNATEDSMDK